MAAGLGTDEDAALDTDETALDIDETAFWCEVSTGEADAIVIDAVWAHRRNLKLLRARLRRRKRGT